jgi:hypothetical protein
MRRVLGTISLPWKGLVAQKLLLLLVQCGARPRQPVVGAQKKAAGAAGRVGNGLHRLGPHAGHHRLDQRAGVKYWPAPLLVSSAFFCSRPFVQIALGVGIQADPVLGVDHLHQARELGRVLDLVLRLEEDRAQHAGLLPSLCSGQVVRLQRLARLRRQAGPVVPLGIWVSRL